MCSTGERKGRPAVVSLPFSCPLVAAWMTSTSTHFAGQRAPLRSRAMKRLLREWLSANDVTRLLTRLPAPLLGIVARVVADVRPLGQDPTWCFDRCETSTDPRVQFRLRVW